MVSRIERLQTRCVCGLPLTVLIIHRRAKTKDSCRSSPSRQIAKIYAGSPPGRITRCPSCDRDFSCCAAADIKDGVFRS